MDRTKASEDTATSSVVVVEDPLTNHHHCISTKKRKIATTSTCCDDDQENASNKEQIDGSNVQADPSSITRVLTRDEIERYSRQMLVTIPATETETTTNDGGKASLSSSVAAFGIDGQRKLLLSRVLVIGAGGIGSSVLLYLAGAGIGTLDIVDFDRVEISNLHRQVIHTTTNAAAATTTTTTNENGDTTATTSCSSDRAGTALLPMLKAESARRAVLALNPTIQCNAIAIPFTHDNALDLVTSYDVVVDASDNPKTRYIVNDACVLASRQRCDRNQQQQQQQENEQQDQVRVMGNKNGQSLASIPLVSASAVGTEGQFTVYNYMDGPCYRCLYPKPPTSEGNNCASCADVGVLGPVPGLVGVLQAMEVIKIITGIGTIASDKLLMYDALQCTFLSVKKLKSTKSRLKCPICGPNPTIRSMDDSHRDLLHSRGPTCDLGGDSKSRSISKCIELQLPTHAMISCHDYFAIRKTNTPHLLLDVRVPQQYDMCALDGAINIPLEQILEKLKDIQQLVSSSETSEENGDSSTTSSTEMNVMIKPIYCICRRGIASSDAVHRLLEAQKTRKDIVLPTTIATIVGGLEAWHNDIDPNFPKY